MPFMLGLHKSAAEGLALANNVWSRETLIVLLDVSRVIRCGPTHTHDLLHLPLLHDLPTSLSPVYSAFGPGAGVCYYPNEAQTAATDAISTRIRAALQSAILEKTETESISSFDPNTIVEKLKAQLKRKANPEDAEFIALFSDTQMFATYILDRHEEIANAIS